MGCVLLPFCFFCGCFLHPLSFHRIILASGALAVQPAGWASIRQILEMSEDADPTASLGPCASTQFLTHFVSPPFQPTPPQSGYKDAMGDGEKGEQGESHLQLSLHLLLFTMGHQASHSISGLASHPLLGKTLPGNSRLLCSLL